jgi:hypothetical protein
MFGDLSCMRRIVTGRGRTWESRHCDASGDDVDLDLGIGFASECGGLYK